MQAFDIDCEEMMLVGALGSSLEVISDLGSPFETCVPLL